MPLPQPAGRRVGKMVRMRTKLRILIGTTLLLLIYIVSTQIQQSHHQQSTLQTKSYDNPSEVNHENSIERTHNSEDENIIPAREYHENAQAHRTTIVFLNLVKESQKDIRENEPLIKSQGEQELNQMKDNEMGMEKWRKGFWASETEEETLFSINVTEVEEIMEERRMEVERGCQEVETLEERSQPPNSKEFLISEKYGLIWCNIFKAASSTWLYNYLKMKGLSSNQLSTLRNSPVEAARKYYPRPSVNKLLGYMADRNYSSFIVVREPFERLLSAYKDKIESYEQAYYNQLRCQILDFDPSQEWKKGKQTRTKDLKRNDSSLLEDHADTSYADKGKSIGLVDTGDHRNNIHTNHQRQKRVKKLHDKADNPHDDPHDRAPIPRKQLRNGFQFRECQPSFRQFVEFVLNEERLGRTHNEHWAPYHKFCSPCQVEFDYVLHFETLPRDEAFLVAKVPGLGGIISQRLHSSHTNYTREQATYFSQLTTALLLDLYHMYRQDFKIFGYSVDKYFDFVTS